MAIVGSEASASEEDVLAKGLSQAVAAAYAGTGSLTEGRKLAAMVLAGTANRSGGAAWR